MNVRRVGERGLIQRIREARHGVGDPGVIMGIGDDTAVLALGPGAALLATTDLVLEDVHFRRASASPRDVGWKAVAVNLSDIAAMGGRPRWALVGLAIPASTEVEEVEAFYEGMREAAAPHGVAIVGGDTSESPGGWFVSVTLLGEHTGTPRLRSAARPGDVVAITGTLGRSAAGLAVLESGAERARAAGIDDAALVECARAHLRPTARVAEGRWLGEATGVHAMIDTSDGIATDLGHICRESGVGARVQVDCLPVAEAAQQAARALARDPIDWAAAGGEDYELLLTCDPAAIGALAAGLRAATGTTLTVIGEIEGSGTGIIWVGPEGQSVEIRPGYEHFSG